MNPKLHEAVAIFKALGWEDAEPENVLNLPLSTAEQKRSALAGLKNGEWGEFAEIKKNTYGWRSFVDVDEGKLALFAVRIGVNAQRAANILRGGDSELLAAVIAERGAKYAADFIGFACVSGRRAWEHSGSVFGSVAVKLVEKLSLDIPQNVEYMKDWSVYAAAAMGLEAEVRYGETSLPDSSLIEKRFGEHISAGVAAGAPATGPFGAVLPAGVKRGWLSRDKAIDLTFAALDASVRPGDRKVWLRVLDELDISDKELCGRAQSLIPLLAAGDAYVVMRLAPVLIMQVEDNLLVEVLLASFSAATKKARQMALKAALGRSCPKNAEELTPWLSILAGDTDKLIASLSVRLLKQWGLNAEILPEEDTEIQGFWQATPPVWQAPPFDMGEASPEALTELAAKLVNRPAVVHDVITERFLAVANAVAYENPEAARTSLRGLRRGDYSLTYYMVCWVKGEKPGYGLDKDNRTAHPISARDYVVSVGLGKLPCLLSTPSAVDLSITVSDLAARLEIYKKTGADAQEADLLLALTRLDVRTKTPKAVEVLKKLDVAIALQSGEKMPVKAGRTVLKYLDDPIKEQLLQVNKYAHWKKENIFMPKSLCNFPNRFDSYMEEVFSVFPLWGDAALGSVGWNGEVNHEQGLILRQAARRADPLPTGASVNILAAQRSMTPDAAEDSMRAVTEAWQRGLLRPGVADVGMLDWSASPPCNLAALSAAFDGIARDGLLSIIWSIVDELISASLKAPRLLAGTAELAELMKLFLPEVQFAVKQGIADCTALELPGIRALAQRSGSSRAVSAARQVAALLPQAQAQTPENENKSVPEMDPSFDQVWSEQKNVLLLIDDGVAVTVDWADTKSATRLFLFTLTLPDISDRVFQIVNRGWYYDLEREGQCQAYAAAPDAVEFVRDKQNQVWLHWDEAQKRMVVCDNRNWINRTDGSLKGIKPPPLSSSLLTVIIGLIAQDGDAVYFAPRMLEEFIENGQIGENMIRRATQTLLGSSAVSPAKLVRVLEKDVKLLYVLWPMLTECVKAAGEQVSSGTNTDKPPVWVNRILDIALRHAPYLIEASKRGLIPREDAQWAGLSEIAQSKAKSTAVAKAKELVSLFL